MPYGYNTAICSKCGRPYVTGDCIDLDGECGECTTLELTENLNLVLNRENIKEGKEKLKKEINCIMNDALAGYIDKYKYRGDDGKIYIRWGRVQRHINEAIDLYWPKR